MMRLLLKAFVVILAVGVYTASPFVTAWKIREAVKTGDAAYLADKIEWAKVKETLKVSLAAAALDLPPEATSDAQPPAQKPTLWQRMKAYWGKGAVDRLVDSYANAQDLPKLFAYRQTYRDTVGHVEEPRTLANLPERMQKAWARVTRAEFTAFHRFEMEMIDKYDAARRFAAILEFTGLEWKLVSLHVHQAKPQSAAGGSIVGGPAAPTNLFARLKAAARGPQLATQIAPSSPLER